MKKEPTFQIIMSITAGIFGTLFGLFVAWLVSGPLHYFGATLITFRDTFGLWVGVPLVLGVLSAYGMSLLTKSEGN